MGRKRSKKMNSTHKLVCPKDLAPQMKVDIGQVVKGSVTYVNTPMNFAVRPTSYEANLKTIGDLCAALPDDRPPMDSVVVGTILGAIYSEDGLWYRGLIQSVNVAQNLATVYFIDYGNTDTVKIEEGLRWLTHDLTQFPPQILECQWVYAPSTNTSEASARLNTLTDSREITMTVVGIIIHSDDPEEKIDIGGEHGSVVVKIKELEKGKFFFGRTLPTLYEVEEETSDSDSDWSESTIEDDDERNYVGRASGIETVAEKTVGKTPEERIEAIIKEAVLRHIGPLSDDSLPIASTSRDVQAVDSFETVVPSVVNALASVFECYLPFGANAELQETDDSNLAMRLFSLEAKLRGYESENQHVLEKFTSYIQFTIQLASEIMKIKSEVAQLNAIAQTRPEGQAAICTNQIRAAVRAETLACRATILAEMDEAKRVCRADIEEVKAWVESTVETAFEDMKNFVEVERHSQRKEITRLWNQMKTDFDNAVAESKCLSCPEGGTSLPNEELESFASVEDELKSCRLQLQAARAKTSYFTDCFEQMEELLAKDRAERDEERLNFRAAMEIKEAELQALRKRWSAVEDNGRLVEGPKPK